MSDHVGKHRREKQKPEDLAPDKDNHPKGKLNIPKRKGPIIGPKVDPKTKAPKDE